MAGYSGTPLPQKLGIKAGARLGLVRAPDGFARTLGELPPGVVTRAIAPGRGGATAEARPDAKLDEKLDVIICFTTALKEVERDLPALRRRLHPSGGLWMAWRKKKAGQKAGQKASSTTSARATDVGENVIREIGLAAGLVDNKVCAIDDVWSGLRFVVRLVDRPKRGG